MVSGFKHCLEKGKGFFKLVGRKTPGKAGIALDRKNRRAPRMLLVSGLVLVCLAAASAPPGVQASAPQDALPVPARQAGTGGEELFRQKCSGCHTIGGGKLVGPDLQDVSARRDPQWLQKFISDPPAMLDSDPIAQQLLRENDNVRMPNLGLSADEVGQLLAFLGAPASGAGSKPAPAGAAAALVGNSGAGEKLFSGEKALVNGGPHCMACHTVSGLGLIGGGSLGPDLTHVAQRFGEVGLAGALKTIAFPTMQGPFLNKALTPQEQADLVAFLKQSDAAQPPVTSVAPGSFSLNALYVFGAGLAIAGLLFDLLAVIWARIKQRYSPRLPVRKL